MHDPETTLCRLRVNGDVRECAVAPHTTLLEALRYELGLTGSKQGCDKGDCGACTVVADGEAVLSCISLALAYHDGPEVITVEGLAKAGRPHPLQDALDECQIKESMIRKEKRAAERRRRRSGTAMYRIIFRRRRNPQSM